MKTNSVNIVLQQLGLPVLEKLTKTINWSSTKKGSGRKHCNGRRKRNYIDPQQQQRLSYRYL